MKEEKGCYFCNAFKYSENGDVAEPLRGKATRLRLELEPAYNETILLYLGNELIDNFNIDFCPKCGRKLRD